MTRALRLTRTLGSRLAPAVVLGLLSSSLLAQTAPTVTVSPASPSVTIRPSDGSEDVIVLVDGQRVEAESVELRRGPQVMIWLRELEKLGWGTIETSGDEVRFNANGVTLTFIKAQGIAKVNSLAVRLPIDTYLNEGRLMVPLSFVAKALGFDYGASQKTVVSIRTGQATPASAIRGKVFYNGKPASGIIVRALNPDYTSAQDVRAVSDAEGSFVLSPLQDGQFIAYVFTGDNPLYFNRASEPAEVKGGEQAEVQPIVLGRIIGSIDPKPGSKVSLAQPKIDFKWTSCPGAASYMLRIKEKDAEEPLFEAESTKPAVQVPAAKLAPDTQYEAEVVATNASGDFLGATAGLGRDPWVFTAVK